ncbi:MAG: hypothetical protein QF408_03590 [Pirellulales bacterium]|jgi:hypothetical protein|nr:hypothetical protein [Pirellulales bacterium]
MTETAIASPVDHVSAPTRIAGAEQLAADIKSEIRQVTSDRIENLGVVLTGTHVILEGFCSTFHAFQLAQHAAMRIVEDLMIVDNQIEVC